MKIVITSVLVDDQDKALRFYTDVLGFVKKTDVPVGDAKWLTVVSPDAGGVERRVSDVLGVDLEVGAERITGVRAAEAIGPEDRERPPQHLLAFFNDYRSVDIAGDTGFGGSLFSRNGFVGKFLARLFGWPPALPGQW